MEEQAWSGAFPSAFKNPSWLQIMRFLLRLMMLPIILLPSPHRHRQPILRRR